MHRPESFYFIYCTKYEVSFCAIMFYLLGASLFLLHNIRIKYEVMCVFQWFNMAMMKFSYFMNANALS